MPKSGRTRHSIRAARSIVSNRNRAAFDPLPVGRGWPGLAGRVRGGASWVRTRLPAPLALSCSQISTSADVGSGCDSRTFSTCRRNLLPHFGSREHHQDVVTTKPSPQRGEGNKTKRRQYPKFLCHTAVLPSGSGAASRKEMTLLPPSPVACDSARPFLPLFFPT